MAVFFRFLLFSMLIHAALAAGVAWVLSVVSGPKVLATLDVSSVELSFAAEECESAPSAVPAAVSRSADERPARQMPPVPSVAMPSVDDGVAVPPLPPVPEIESCEPPTEKLVVVETPSEPVPSESAPSVASAAPRQARVDAPPRPQRSIRPDYPRGARQRGEQGDVVLEIGVAADGAVASVAVATSSGSSDLDAAAVKAVRSARFTPAKSGDRSVASTARLTLSFRLK